MDLFRTVVEIQPSEKKIAYDTPLILLGSCFSDYIGERIQHLKFTVSTNPFGVLYNPLSIAEDISILIENKPFTPDHLYYHNGQWISFNHYTGFSHPDRDKCLDRINTSITSSAILLKKAGFLFITFGTAWVYKFNTSGKVVANCHRIPASAFTRFLLTPDEIIHIYDILLDALWAINPGLTVVLTISPVRHWKDGAVNNQKSKAILHYAIDMLREHYPALQYFPAYEIFMDELRDYRFYAGDMLHPSEPAIDYVWKRFTDTFMGIETIPLMREIQTLMKTTGHRPINPEDPSYKSFLIAAMKNMNRLSENHPEIDFHPETEKISRLLKDMEK
jgi:hypothetical protein